MRDTRDVKFAYEDQIRSHIPCILFHAVVTVADQVNLHHPYHYMRKTYCSLQLCLTVLVCYPQGRYRREDSKARPVLCLPLVGNLLKDNMDGCALAALLHFYCPDAVLLEGTARNTEKYGSLYSTEFVYLLSLYFENIIYILSAAIDLESDIRP